MRTIVISVADAPLSFQPGGPDTVIPKRVAQVAIPPEDIGDGARDARL